MWKKVAALAFGVLFVGALLGLAVAFPKPTPFQYTVFRIVLALACGGVAAVIPGFLAVSMDAKGLAIRAGGALAVFLFLYFFNPAQMVVSPSLRERDNHFAMNETGQFEYRIPPIEIDTVPGKRDWVQALVVFDIKNTGRVLVRVALVYGFTLQIEGGFHFNLPNGQMISGLSYCDSQKVDSCKGAVKDYTLLRPGYSLSRVSKNAPSRAFLVLVIWAS